MDSVSISPDQFSVFQNVVLPAGISFYTFQSMSYTIDVFRGEIKPTKDLIKFFAFLTFFPQLIAGPIERAKVLLCQFDSTPNFSNQAASYGLYMILWGAFKKLVIADPVGRIVDIAYAESITSSIQSLICGVGFGIQIYCDFSGYSDMDWAWPQFWDITRLSTSGSLIQEPT